MRASVSSVVFLKLLSGGLIGGGGLQLARTGASSDADYGSSQAMGRVLALFIEKCTQDWCPLEHSLEDQVSTHPRGRILLRRLPASMTRRPFAAPCRRPAIRADADLAGVVANAAGVCLRTGVRPDDLPAIARLSLSAPRMEGRALDAMVARAASRDWRGSPRTTRWLLAVSLAILSSRQIVEQCSRPDGRGDLIELTDQALGSLFQRAVTAYLREALLDDDLEVTGGNALRWNSPGDPGFEILPKMIPDILVSGTEVTIVADCKATGRILVFDEVSKASRLERSHLFQLHAYLSRFRTMQTAKAVGALLYAIEGIREEARVDLQFGGFKLLVAGVRVDAGFGALLDDLQALAAAVRLGLALTTRAVVERAPTGTSSHPLSPSVQAPY